MVNGWIWIGAIVVISALIVVSVRSHQSPEPRRPREITKVNPTSGGNGRALTWRPPSAARRCEGAARPRRPMPRSQFSFDLFQQARIGLLGHAAPSHRGPAKPGPPGQRASPRSFPRVGFSFVVFEGFVVKTLCLSVSGLGPLSTTNTLNTAGTSPAGASTVPPPLPRSRQSPPDLHQLSTSPGPRSIRTVWPRGQSRTCLETA